MGTGYRISKHELDTAFWKKKLSQYLTNVTPDETHSSVGFSDIFLFKKIVYIKCLNVNRVSFEKILLLLCWRNTLV